MVDAVMGRRSAGLMYLVAEGGKVSLLDPLFNLREVAKQMLLLEDHLQHSNKHCPDCIRKHLMTIEAFSEEATTLDTHQAFFPLTERLAESARGWSYAFSNGADLFGLAQQVRKERKELVQLIFSSHSPATKVAQMWHARRHHSH